MSDPVTKEELTEAVAAGIHQAFIRLGINHADPIEVQADMAFLRKLRMGSGKMTWSMPSVSGSSSGSSGLSGWREPWPE